MSLQSGTSTTSPWWLEAVEPTISVKPSWSLLVMCIPLYGEPFTVCAKINAWLNIIEDGKQSSCRPNYTSFVQTGTRISKKFPMFRGKLVTWFDRHNCWCVLHRDFRLVRNGKWFPIKLQVKMLFLYLLFCSSCEWIMYWGHFVLRGLCPFTNYNM